MAETLEALEDWEEFDPDSGLSFFNHALAGSLAGAAEHGAIFPVDTIKTHLQASRKDPKAPLQIIRQLMNESKGPFRLWRGVSTMLGACVPAHAAYFSVFEQCKHQFGANGPTHTPFAAALSGSMATIFHDLIMTPMDVVKQRLQLGFYDGTSHCMRQIIKTEGVKALYLSFPTTLLMNIPFGAVMVSTNESVKRFLNPNNEYSLSSFVIAGGIAGGVAAFVTNPLDVVKTRLQTQNLLETERKTVKFKTSSRMWGRFISHPVGLGVRATFSVRKLGEGRERRAYGSFVETIRKIGVEEGWRGFTRGALSRVLVHSPSVAISWATYETAKRMLQF